MEQRLSKVCARLRALPGRAVAAWRSGGIPSPLVGLEFSHLLAAACINDKCLAFRFAGTLELNDIEHQRILFAGDNLVRIVNGPRRNLVVRPYNLRYEEEAVPAGVEKELEPGDEPWRFSHRRDGDIELLGQLEEALEARRSVAVVTLPMPPTYKRVLDHDQVKPVINGRLVARLREFPDFRKDESVTDAFRRHIMAFCEQREGGFVFPMNLVACRGRTVLDLSDVLGEAYIVPLEGMDVSSEVFRTEVRAHMGREKAPWCSASS